MHAEIGPEVIRLTVGLPESNARAVWRDHFGPGFNIDGFRQLYSDKFHALAESQLCLKAGVTDLLDLLDRLGLPRAIVTSSARAVVDHHLAKAKLAERFDLVVAYGDYPHGKPHPAPHLTAAKALGVEPAHCLALEDSHTGVRSAAAAGMMTVMVPDVLAATGEMRSLCAAVAHDLHEVAALLA